MHPLTVFMHPFDRDCESNQTYEIQRKIKDKINKGIKVFLRLLAFISIRIFFNSFLYSSIVSI